MTIKNEIARLLDAYPSFTPRNPAGQLETYQRHLGDIPEWLLAQAVDAHIRESKFFPSVAELRALCHKLSGTVELANAQKPGTQWSTATYWQAMSLFNAGLKAGNVELDDAAQQWQTYQRRCEEVGR